jgi:hypothetical protein
MIIDDRRVPPGRRSRPGGERHRQVAAGRALYRQLGRHGLQSFVTSLLAHRPVRGRSVVFSTAGNRLVEDAVVRAHRFCRDSRVGGVLHPGRRSLREIGPTSLHVILERGDRLSVHVDRSGPAVGARADGGCIYDHRRTAGHIRQDVLSSLRRGPWGWGRAGDGRAAARTEHAPPVVRFGSPGAPGPHAPSLDRRPPPGRRRRRVGDGAASKPSGSLPFRRAPPRVRYPAFMRTRTPGTRRERGAGEAALVEAGDRDGDG